MTIVGLIPSNYDQSFSLKSLSVECNIRNLLVSCKSEFAYKNNENEDIEALFSFPLDSNCVVYYLEAFINNKTIIAVCKEIEEAKNMYKVAKEMGHAATIIERNVSMRDVFNCRIGNFPKKSEAKIILKFAMELKLSLVRSKEKGVDRMNLALPLLLRPRYTPAGYGGEQDIFPVVNKYDYHFKANLDGTKIICNISSVNHSLDIKYTNDTKTSAEVILKSKYDGTKDLDIHIDYAEIREPSVVYELGTKSDRYNGAKVNGAFYQSDVAMINFLPKLDQVEPTNQQKLEIVFVVDRSGSMGGSNIARAKECLLIFLKSLPVNCKFQIYGFGSIFDKAFNDSQLYSDQSINIALNYQKNLDANFGGTELMQPLRDLYSASVGSDYVRVVFLLTDGDVGNQDEVTSLVRKHNKSTRLFTVGIGDGVSTSLVDQVAQAGLGKSVFVRNAKELSASVMELLDIAINFNPITDTKIEWKCPEHVSIISVPTVIPPIFSDYFLTVFCMINGMRSNDTIQCTLSGYLDGNRVSFSIEINDSGAICDEEFRVHRLLAKYKIDEMTVQIEDGQEDLKKALIEMSTDINIITNWTTFVAIDQDAPQKALVYDELEEQHLEFYKAAPCVMSSQLRSCGSANSSRMRNITSVEKKMAYGRKKDFCSMIESGQSIPREEVKDEISNQSVEYPEPTTVRAKAMKKSKFAAFFKRKSSSDKSDDGQGTTEKEKNTKNIIISFVQKQNINGSWNYEEDLFVEMGLNLAKIKNHKPENVSDEIWATIIIYQFLVTKLQSKEKEWRLFAKKAKQWVESRVNDSNLLTVAFKASLEVLK